MSKRFAFIDIAKGFAIIFIVMGHTIRWSEHSYLIYKFLLSFHVVLFFILSGYTFKIDNSETFISFLKKKFIRIMIPYFIWATIYLIPYMILGQNVNEALGTKASFDFSTQIVNVIYGIGKDGALRQNSSLWFLPALFTMEIFYYFVIKRCENKKTNKYFTISVLLIISYLSTYFLNINLPWGINTTLSLGIFFYIGYLINKYNILEKIKLQYIFLIFFIGICACFLNVIDVSCMNYNYGIFTLALISGLMLSYTVIYISYRLKSNFILEYIGKNTMGILIFHKLIIVVFQTKMGFITTMLVNTNIIVEFILSIMISFISIFISIIISNTIKKYMPFLLGQKRSFSKVQNEREKIDL